MFRLEFEVVRLGLDAQRSIAVHDRRTVFSRAERNLPRQSQASAMPKE
jgi:hypothetical protein